MDHPIYHMANRLDTNLSKFIVTSLDYKHLNFLKEQYDKNHFLTTSFFVPGGSESTLFIEESIEEFDLNRNVPLLFTGSNRGIPEKSWKVYQDKFTIQFMDDIYEYTMSDDYILVEDAFEYILREKNIELPKDKRNAIKLDVMIMIQEYIAAQKRYSCLEALARNEIPIEIYGSGWDDWSAKYPSIKYYDVGTVEKTLDILTKTKLCLNINNSFVAGGHERVFNAMINGAAVISDKSLFYDENFVEGKEILTYSWNHLDSMVQMVQKALDNPYELWEISRNARKKVKEKFTWEHKAKEIIELYQSTI